MKNIILAFSFFALLFASHTVEAQAINNVYRYSYEVDSLAGETSYFQEIPVRLLSLWTLGGSFNVTNLGALANDFTVNVFATSDPTVEANSSIGWQLIKQVSITTLAAGATSYQHFRAANEMFYIGHTRMMIQFESADAPGSLDANLVLKKE